MKKRLYKKETIQKKDYTTQRGNYIEKNYIKKI